MFEFMTLLLLVLLQLILIIETLTTLTFHMMLSVNLVYKLLNEV